MLDRRTFLQSAGAFALAGLTPTGAQAASAFTALGAPVPLALANSEAYGAEVLASDAGGYFAVWSSFDRSGTGSTSGSYARRYAADGTPATVVHHTAGDFYGMAVVTLSDGNALVFGNSVAPRTIIGRTLTAAGFGAREVAIDGVGKEPTGTLHAARLADGNILVVWSQQKVYGQIVTSSLNLVGKPFLISNGSGVLRSHAPAVVPLASGGAAVAMLVSRADGFFHVVQRIRPGGGTIGPLLRPPRLAAMANTGVALGLVALPQGGVALLWHSAAGEFGGHIFSDDGASVAPIATVRWPLDTTYVTTIPAVACGSEIIVAPVAKDLTFTSFDAATGRRTRPFASIATGVGDCNSLARLSNGTLVAATFGHQSGVGYQSWLQRFKLG